MCIFGCWVDKVLADKFIGFDLINLDCASLCKTVSSWSDKRWKGQLPPPALQDAEAAWRERLRSGISWIIKPSQSIPIFVFHILNLICSWFLPFNISNFTFNIKPLQRILIFVFHILHFTHHFIYQILHSISFHHIRKYKQSAWDWRSRRLSRNFIQYTTTMNQWGWKF